MNAFLSPESQGLRLASVQSLDEATAAGLLVRPGRLTIGLMSDLHTESGLSPQDVPCPDVDVWVAAGDIATQKSNLSSVQWLAQFSALSVKQHGRVAPILFIPGNHDFYRGVVPQARERWERESAGTPVHVLENKALVLAGVRFLGTPLWSNFSGAPALLRPHVARAAERSISDFFVIESSPFVRWTTADLVREHDDAYRFLADSLGVPYVEDGVFGQALLSEEAEPFRSRFLREMAYGGHDGGDPTLRLPGEAAHRPTALGSPSMGPGSSTNEARARDVATDGLTVALTHWAPHLRANHPMFVGGELSAYFVNHHPELCRAVNLWLFGHTHTLSDFVVDDGPDDRDAVEQTLLCQRDAWRGEGGLDGPRGNDPLFDPQPLRDSACWGRAIAHPRGYPKERVPGLGPEVYAPLVLSLFPDGHTERGDGR